MLIYACDGLDQIGRVDDWSELSVVERDLDVGNWSITVPLDGDSADVVRTWTRDDVDSSIEVFDPDTGWRFGGPSITKETEISLDGTSVTVRGVDHMIHLARRVMLFLPLNSEDYWLDNIQQSYDLPAPAGWALSSEVHLMVYEQIDDNPVNAFRRMTNLSGFFEDDPELGPTPTYRVEAGTTILEQVRSLVVDQDFTVRMRLDRRTNSGVEESSIRFSTPPRTEANVRLSVANGGYEKVTITETRAPWTNTIAVGSEDPGNPGVRFAIASQQLPNKWGSSLYGEQYFNRDGYDDSTLVQEQHAEYLGSFPTSTVRFEGVEVEGFGRRVDVGWLVPAEVTIGGRTELYELPVGSSELSGRPGDLRRKISVGEHQPQDMERILDMLRRVDTRLRKVERRA